MESMRRLLILASAIVLVDTISYAALVPLVPYFSQTLGLSKSAVGLLSGAFGAGVLVGSVPGTYLTSRVGVKPAALVGLSLLSLTSLAFGLVETPWALVSVRFIGGVGSAFSWVSAFTWLTSRVPEEKRGQSIGIMLSAAVAGALLGPVVGSAAASIGIFPSFAVLGALSVVILLWTVLETAPKVGAPSPLLRMLRRAVSPGLLPGLWLIALSPLLFGSLAVLVPLELEHSGWGATAVGTVFLVSAAFEAIVHPSLGRWTDRSGYLPPVRAGVLGSIGVLLVLSGASNPWLLGLLVVLAAGAFNATLVPGTALFSRGTEKAGIDQALAFGLTNVAWASGYAVGAPLAGVLADLGGDTLSYLSLVGVCGATLVLLGRGKVSS